MSSLLAGKALPPPPVSVDYTVGMPSDLGALLNDRLGDCTCAAWGHAVQVWSFNAQGAMQTLPDQDIERLYQTVGGYVPGNPATDNGAVEQDVLSYLARTGLDGNRLAAFVEVDPRNTDDVKRAICWSGVAYIGILVPSFLMSSMTSPGSTWDLDLGGDQRIEGGHAVILAGYDADAVYVISWGNRYRMTWRFFAQFCEEVYALADETWIRTTGLSPAGLSLVDLESQMQAIREAGL